MESSASKKTNKEAETKKSDAIETERRIYQVSLMLRRKPVSFILQYSADKWKIEARQTRNYIRKARKDWEKYSEKLKAGARAYSLAKLRDLNDMAHSKKVVVGTVDNKQVTQIQDLGIIMDIIKEEAKIMGIYPPDKHKIELPEEIKVKVDLTE